MITMNNTIIKYFEKTTKSIDETLERSNQPVKLINNDGYEYQEATHDGTPLYWQPIYESIKISPGKEIDGYGGIVLFVNFSKKGDYKSSNIEFEKKDVEISTLRRVHGEASYCSFRVLLNDLEAHLYAAVEKVINLYMNNLHDIYNQLKAKKIPSIFTLKSALYTSDEGNVYISGIKFPEPPTAKKGTTHPCWCSGNEKCYLPLKHKDDDQKGLDIENHALLKNEVETRLKLEVYGPNHDKIKNDVVEYFKVANFTNEIKHKKYQIYKNYVGDEVTTDNQNSARVEYEEARGKLAESRKIRYCHGNINGLLPSGTVFNTAKGKLSRVYVNKDGIGTIKYEVSVIRFTLPINSSKDIDDDLKLL